MLKKAKHRTKVDRESKTAQVYPRQSQADNENKGEGATKIQENNLNVGLVNFQQESFNFNRVLNLV